MVDLHGQYVHIKSAIDHAIQEVLESTAFIKGPQVDQFERSLTEFHQGAQAITCGNGTDALQIAMMALGFKPGDEVILPVFTYVATAEVIALLGLRPVFVDVDEKTFTINAGQIEACVSPKTVAIVPVHLFGQCADMEPILAIAEKHNLCVIEDFAQAFGARYALNKEEKAKAGTLGTIGCTSFFPSKNLGCYGDGGALIIKDTALAERARMIANHGQKIKYYHDVVGVNSRLDTLQAAILNVKIRHIEEYENRRQEVARFYDQALSGLPFLEIPSRSMRSPHVFHQYTIKLKGIDRGHFKSYLESNGIPSMIYYPVPLHLQRAYRVEEISNGAFPVSEALCKCVISLPIHTEMEQSTLSFITETIQAYKGSW